MNFEFSQLIDRLTGLYDGMSPSFALGFTLLFFTFWFLPSIVALFCNRRHLGKIFLANFAAGISWVAWVAVLVWAATGKYQRGNRSAT